MYSTQSGGKTSDIGGKGSTAVSQKYDYKVLKHNGDYF